MAKRGYTQLKENLNGLPLPVYTRNGREFSTPQGMPSTITIYGQKYVVKYHSHIYAEPKAAQRLRGIVIYSFRMIYIDPRQTIHDLRETLYHEVGHLYLKVWQTKAEPLAKLSPQAVEALCDMFAEGLIDCTENNP